MSQDFTPSHFSLSEEARNTGRHHSWNSDLKLRHSRISFVSAGTSTAQDLNSVSQECETSDEATKSSFQAKNGAPVEASGNLSTATVTLDTQMSKLTLKGLRSTSASQVKLEMGLDSISERSNVDSGLESAEASSEAPFIDHKGANEPLHTGLVTSTVGRSASPTGSASSGEIIIFAGRWPSCKRSDQNYNSDAESRNLNAPNMPKPSGSLSSMATVIEDSIIATAQGVQPSPRDRPSSFLPRDTEKASGYLSPHPKVPVTRSGRRKRRRHPGEEIKDDGILDDYVANLRERGALKDFVESSMLNQRDLGGSDTAEWQGEAESLTMGLVERNSMTDSEEWDSAQEDFDELSRSNEVLKNIQKVLSKRKRPSGVQYLVVEAGCTVEDARWFPVSSLNMQGARTLIQEFENHAKLDHLNGSDLSDASSTIDEQVARDLQDDFNEQEDEQDLEERRKARMTDEQIARLLSKQDELGLGSDGLMLFDGADVEMDSQDELQLDGLWERAVTHRVSCRSKKMKQSRSKFPSATAFANVLDQDPYNGSDVMGQQRPGVRARPKSRSEKLSLELSDSELEHSIRRAWQKDRTKKKMRKQEREELRAQGLLGKKPKNNLKAKYSEGISMTQVKKEIRDFLLSSMERYVPRTLRLITNTHGNPVCRFHQWLRMNVKWCMKSPMSSN